MRVPNTLCTLVSLHICPLYAYIAPRVSNSLGTYLIYDRLDKNNLFAMNSRLNAGNQLHWIAQPSYPVNCRLTALGWLATCEFPPRYTQIFVQNWFADFLINTCRFYRKSFIPILQNLQAISNAPNIFVLVGPAKFNGYPDPAVN